MDLYRHHYGWGVIPDAAGVNTNNADDNEEISLTLKDYIPGTIISGVRLSFGWTSNTTEQNYCLRYRRVV